MKRIISTVLAIIMTAAAVCMFVSAQNGVILKGDVNGDGELDNKDVVALFRYVSGGEKAEDDSVYDINGDGGVDNKDVTALFRELSGGKASEETPVVISENKLYLYADSKNGKNDDKTEKYKGKDFLSSAKRTTKSNMEAKTTEMFGMKYISEYLETLSFDLYDEKYDMYISDAALFTFDEETGRLATFDDLSGVRANGFTPPVNAQSTEKEFVSYAKEVLLEYAGTSTDDCDVIVESFNGKYEITFKKRFSEIYRIDDISVTISKNGDVLKIKSRTCDSKIEPFNGIELDAEKLRKQIKAVSYSSDYLSYEIVMSAIPDGNELWVLAEVKYKYEEDGEVFGGGNMYLTKVAEIPSGEPVTDPVQTEPETEDFYIDTEIE